LAAARTGPLPAADETPWLEIDAELHRLIKDGAHGSWFNRIGFHGVNDGVISLSTPPRIAADRIKRDYAEAIKQAAENVGVLVRPAHPMPASAAVVGQHRLPLSVAQLTNVALPSSTADQMEAAEPGFVPPPIDQSGCGPSALFSRTRPVLASTPTSWVLPPLLMSKE